MEISSTHQMYVFLLCVAIGILCGVIFDFQRSLRKKFIAGFFRTTLEDFLFSVICIGAVISLGYFFNSGQIRYYQIMGSLSGVLFYGAFLTGPVMKFFAFLFSMTEKILIKPAAAIIKISLVPMREAGHILKKLNNKAYYAVKRITRLVKNKKKHLKKRIKML